MSNDHFFSIFWGKQNILFATIVINIIISIAEKRILGFFACNKFSLVLSMELLFSFLLFVEKIPPNKAGRFDKYFCV